MKSKLLALMLLTAGICSPAFAEVWFMHVSEASRGDSRDAVDARRVAKREEAVVGRRLTAAELAELRRQVRQQWAPRVVVVDSAESVPAERVVTPPVERALQTPVSNSSTLVAPVSRRP